MKLSSEIFHFFPPVFSFLPPISVHLPLSRVVPMGEKILDKYRSRLSRRQYSHSPSKNWSQGMRGRNKSFRRLQFQIHQYFFCNIGKSVIFHWGTNTHTHTFRRLAKLSLAAKRVLENHEHCHFFRSFYSLILAVVDTIHLTESGNLEFWPSIELKHVFYYIARESNWAEPNGLIWWYRTNGIS